MIVRERKVDSREPWDTIIEPLVETGWERDTLWHGDFYWLSYDMAKVGATRKTTTDLLTSLLSDIFPQQLEEMLALYDINILIHERAKGCEYDRALDEFTIVTKEKVIRIPALPARNFIHTWQAKGFIFERTSSQKNTVNRLNELYAMYQKPYSTSAKSRRYRDERILALCSGLRGEKGYRLLSKFSLREIFNMDIPQLQEQDGIGKIMAERQVELANRKSYWNGEVQ